MSEILQSDDACTLSAHSLRLSFVWDGTRWTHKIEAGEMLLASTVEWEPGLGDPTRVVSPAFQQMSIQQEGDSSLALLVGQWGHHHFSGVFTFKDDASGVVVIEADVAVRTRGTLEALASTYRVDLTSSDLIDADHSAIEWAVNSGSQGRLRFEAGAAPSMRVSMAEAGRRKTRVQANAPLDSGSAATHRLLYRWRWISNGRGDAAVAPRALTVSPWTP
jgi:hypothetical protein